MPTENFSEISTPDGTITFAIMQTNFWVGDIKGNVGKMKALALDAKHVERTLSSFLNWHSSAIRQKICYFVLHYQSVSKLP